MARVQVEHIMGTVISIDVRDAIAVDVEPAFAWFREVDARFSTYKSDSEINRIAHGELDLANAHQDVREVLALCDMVSARSGGAFSIRRTGDPSVLDPSAVVKGWSVDRAAAMLDAVGVRNFCINAGGDVVTRGAPEPGRPWRVGIRHPSEPDRSVAIVLATDLAVATSGLYERGGHIVNPIDGAVPTDVVSMTVAGASLALADAYSTAAFVMGRDGVAWVATLGGYCACAVTADWRRVSTPEFRSRLDEPLDQSAGSEVHDRG